MFKVFKIPHSFWHNFFHLTRNGSRFRVTNLGATMHTQYHCSKCDRVYEISENERGVVTKVEVII